MRARHFAVFAVAILIAVAVIGPVTAEPAEAAYSEEQEDVKGLGFVAGLAIGLTLGFILGVTATSDPKTPASDQDEVYKQLRGLYADKMVTAWDTAKDMISSVMPADASLWSFTTSYWNRAVELAVAESWALGLDYDPDEMVDISLLRQNAQNYIYDWQAAVDVAYKSIADKHTKLTGDCYGDMTVSLVWDGGSMTADGSSEFYADLLQIVTTAGTTSTVYIDTSDWDEGGNYVQTTSGNLYVFGKSVTLRYLDTGRTYTMSVGANDITSMPSGLYRIETSGAAIAGPLSKAASSDATEVRGGMVLVSGSQLAYVLPEGEGVRVTLAGGSSVASSELAYEVSYTGSDGAATDRSLICGESGKYSIVRDWDGMVSHIGEVIDRAAIAGEAIWGIFDAAEASNSFLSPSSITTTVEGVTLTAVQSQAIYTQAMMQIADYWEQYGDDLSNNPEFTTNRESLDLYCYGDIYFNGQIWAENVVFTPYNSLSDQTLVVGETTEWQGSGFAMVWAQVDDFASWDGATSSSQYALIDLSTGYELVIEEIRKDGQEVDSITLQQTTIKRYNSGSSEGGDDPPDPVKVLDAGMLITVIVLELALILFLLGYLAGQPVVGLIAALVVAFVGVFFSDTIASMALGTFSWPWELR